MDYDGNKPNFVYFELYLILICFILSVICVLLFYIIYKEYASILFYIYPMTRLPLSPLLFKYVQYHYENIKQCKQRREYLSNTFDKHILSIIELYLESFDYDLCNKKLPPTDTLHGFSVQQRTGVALLSDSNLHQSLLVAQY